MLPDILVPSFINICFTLCFNVSKGRTSHPAICSYSTHLLAYLRYYIALQRNTQGRDALSAVPQGCVANMYQLDPLRHCTEGLQGRKKKIIFFKNKKNIDITYFFKNKKNIDITYFFKK